MTIQSPTMSRRIGIVRTSVIDGTVVFDADAVDVELIRRFGHVAHLGGNRYRLEIDARFEYDRVVHYLVALPKEFDDDEGTTSETDDE